MENIEVMVILFIIVVLGYTLCKLGYMGDQPILCKVSESLSEKA